MKRFIAYLLLVPLYSVSAQTHKYLLKVIPFGLVFSSFVFGANSHESANKKIILKNYSTNISDSSDLLESLICLKFFKNDKLDFASVTQPGISYASLLQSGQMVAPENFGKDFERHFKNAYKLSDEIENLKKTDFEILAEFSKLNAKLKSFLDNGSVIMTQAMVLGPNDSSVLENAQVKKSLGTQRISSLKKEYEQIQMKYTGHLERLEKLDKGLSNKAFKLSSNHDLENFSYLLRNYTKATDRLKDNFGNQFDRASLKAADPRLPDFKKINSAKAYIMANDSYEWLLSFDVNGNGQIGERKLGSKEEPNFRPLCKSRAVQKPIADQANDIMRAALSKGHISFSPEECAILKKAWAESQEYTEIYGTLTFEEMFMQKILDYSGFSDGDAEIEAFQEQMDGIELAIPSTFLNNKNSELNKCYQSAKEKMESMRFEAQDEEEAEAIGVAEENLKSMLSTTEYMLYLRSKQIMKERSDRFKSSTVPSSIPVADIVNSGECDVAQRLQLNPRTGHYEFTVALQNYIYPEDSEPKVNIIPIMNSPILTIDSKHIKKGFDFTPGRRVLEENDYYKTNISCPEK